MTEGSDKSSARSGKTKTLLTLFTTMFYISSFTFGGGFVIITFMKRKFVDELKWLNEAEMLDYTALAQTAPGAIAVNAAILVGWRTAGFSGMLAAVTGTILPPLLIIPIIAFFYNAFASNLYVAVFLRGMQAGVAAVIIDVVFSLGGNVVKGRSLLNILIMAAAFIAVFFFNVNVVYVILAAALLGFIKKPLQRMKGRKK